MKTGVIDFAVFEDGKEYLGTANVQLPDITQKVIGVSAVGLGGDIEIPTGKVDAMSVTINFETVTPAASQLTTMRTHMIELRVAHQDYDRKTGSTSPAGVKYVMRVMPKTETLGQVQAASPQAVSGEYALHAIKIFHGNDLVRHVDPINNINWDKDNGNLLAGYQKILGK